jgi:hypothetical protein
MTRPRTTAFALAALTYANAALTYAVLTAPEAATAAGALRKLAVSLPWLLPLASPFALLFALAGTPLVRRTYARLRHRGHATALAAALAAFLIPASLITEAALAWRDGWSWPRLGLQLAGGAVIGMLGAAILGSVHGGRRGGEGPRPDIPDE